MSMTTTSVVLPDPMLAELRKEARENDLSLSQVIRRHIRAAKAQDSPVDLRRQEADDGDR